MVTEGEKDPKAPAILPHVSSGEGTRSQEASLETMASLAGCGLGPGLRRGRSVCGLQLLQVSYVLGQPKHLAVVRDRHRHGRDGDLRLGGARPNGTVHNLSAPRLRRSSKQLRTLPGRVSVARSPRYPR